MLIPVLLAAVLGSVPTSSTAGVTQEQTDLAHWPFHPCEGDESTFRIGVLHHSTDSMQRLLRGVAQALDAEQEKYPGLPFKICVHDLPYANPNQGLDLLRSSIIGREVDLIIGPTESDVFVRGLGDEAGLAEHQIMVISPLIVAEAGNDPDGYFFRTNIGARHRVQRAFDYLRKRWVRSMAVLYEDTEFGRASEIAFRAEVADEFGNLDNYIAEPFGQPPNAREDIRKVLRARPEALGIFGGRENLPVLAHELKSMSVSGAPYEPIIFTVLDASRISARVGNFFFVSATQEEYLLDGKQPGEFDDVSALAYDTTYFVLKVLDEVAQVYPLEERAEFLGRLRERFSAVMSGGGQGEGPKTGMIFSGYRNQGPREIYVVDDEEIESIELERYHAWLNTFFSKIGLVFDRYGSSVILAVLMLLGVVILNSTWDLARWYEGSWWKIFRYPRVYALFFIQFSASFLMYVYLAEHGTIRYDSIGAAAAIGFTPSQVFKLGLFETKDGQSIGLVAFYDRALRQLNEGLMVGKYKDLEKKIQIVAHYNSEVGMRDELKAIFSHHRNPKSGQRIMEELENDLKDEGSSWARRRICAKALIRRLKWADLRERSLVPAGVSEKDPTGPIDWVRKSLHHIHNTPGALKRLDDLLEKLLKEREQSDNDYFNRKISEVDNPRDQLFSKIRFLVLKLGYNEEMLRKENLMGPESAEPSVRLT